MRSIGITGGIGAGKSTILDYLRERYQAVIVQADLIGHEVMEPGASCYQAVIKLLGQEVVGADGRIDRKTAGRLVFQDESLRLAMNRLIHPAVEQRIRTLMEAEQKKGCRLFVVEAALLLEAGLDRFCDEVWVVMADKKNRICRLMADRGYSREKCLQIMASQEPDSFYLERADVVIDNSRDPDYAFSQIDQLPGLGSEA